MAGRASVLPMWWTPIWPAPMPPGADTARRAEADRKTFRTAAVIEDRR
jgi:hypothetical protein